MVEAAKTSDWFFQFDLGGQGICLAPLPKVDNGTGGNTWYNDSCFLGFNPALGFGRSGEKLFWSIMGRYVWNADNAVTVFTPPQTSTVPGGGTIDPEDYTAKAHLAGFGGSANVAANLGEDNRQRIGGDLRFMYAGPQSASPIDDRSGMQPIDWTLVVGPAYAWDFVSRIRGGALSVGGGLYGGLLRADGETSGTWMAGLNLSGRLNVGLSGSCEDSEEVQVWKDKDNDGYGTGAPKMVCDVPDGWAARGDDCNDSPKDKNDDGVSDGYPIHPNATEIPNDGIDQDCQNGDLKTQTYYRDLDGDTWGVASVTLDAERQPEGYTDRAGDCNDTDNTVYPGAEEICDDVDNSCNGQINEGLTCPRWYPDRDRDGYGDRTSPGTLEHKVNYVQDHTDCNDSAEDTDGDGTPDGAAIHPGATDKPGDGIDQDCQDGDAASRAEQKNYWRDLDDDGYGGGDPKMFTSVEAADVAGYPAEQGGDCLDDPKRNTKAAEVNPDAEEVPGDGLDNDCNGTADDVTNVTVDVRQEMSDLARDVKFVVGKDVLRPQAKKKLDEVARILTTHPELTLIAIDGHTSTEDTPENNLDLSQRRAQAVVEYLVTVREIERARLEVRAFGETQPLADDKEGTDEQAANENRRVEILVLETNE